MFHSETRLPSRFSTAISFIWIDLIGGQGTVRGKLLAPDVIVGNHRRAPSSPNTSSATGGISNHSRQPVIAVGALVQPRAARARQMSLDPSWVSLSTIRRAISGNFESRILSNQCSCAGMTRIDSQPNCMHYATRYELSECMHGSYLGIGGWRGLHFVKQFLS